MAKCWCRWSLSLRHNTKRKQESIIANGKGRKSKTANTFVTRPEWETQSETQTYTQTHSYAGICSFRMYGLSIKMKLKKIIIDCGGIALSLTFVISFTKITTAHCSVMVHAPCSYAIPNRFFHLNACKWKYHRKTKIADCWWTGAMHFHFISFAYWP